MTDYRIERDSMGDVKVPQQALFAAQTQRAVDNFSISGLTMPSVFIRALALIKQSAAQTNAELGLLELEIAEAITDASRTIAAGKHLEQFPVDVFQTGSGTSSNMNANEVIATLASRSFSKGNAARIVSPNDHVNMGQSSNDVIPTAIHLSAGMVLHERLLPALHHLHDSLLQKASTVTSSIKTGRTHLMDAMPVRLSQELEGWAAQISQGIDGLESFRPRLQQMAQGGTAVGTGINAHEKFSALFADHLSTNSGLTCVVADNFFAALSSQDTVVALSGQLKTIAVSLMKIANDLRWMNSGPLAGLAEIELQVLQPGSSIMPGKVNPVIPEAVAMVAAQVIGNDATITVAGQSGNFQLNVMLPVIAHNLLQSMELLSNSVTLLADKAVTTFTVQEENLRQALSRNPILVTALNPVIGYLKAAEIAKKAYASGRPILDVAEEETALSRQELETLLDPARLVDGGLVGGQP